MKEKTKIVDIEGTQYQIGRFSPEVGSYIAMNILGIIVKSQRNAVPNGSGNPSQEMEIPAAANRDPQEIVRGMTFAAYLSGLDYDFHCFVQRKCLEVCSRIESQPGQDSLPMPLARLPDVLSDMPLVMRLETETLAFNLADFFAGGGLKAMTGNSQPSSKVTSASPKG